MSKPRFFAVLAVLGAIASCSSSTSTPDGGACVGSSTLCQGSCVETQIDPNNCGMCGKVCPMGQACSQGQCAVVCVGGTSLCGTACVELAVDPNNCGSCGHVCAAGEVCSGSKCALACTAGLTACPASPVVTVDGGTDASSDASPEAGSGNDAGLGQVCVDTKTDNANCGGCGMPCTGQLTCGGGTCQMLPTTWDPTWTVGGTFSNGNLSASGNTPGTKNVRTKVGRSTGKFYWEVTVTAGDGGNWGGIGIASSAFPTNGEYLGSDPASLGFGYGSGGYYYSDWPGATVNGKPPNNSNIIMGTTYMFALDMSVGNFWAGQGGTWYNAGDPGAGTNAAATGLSGAVYPAATFYSESINALTANFGASAFTYTVPTGFQSGFY